MLRILFTFFCVATASSAWAANEPPGAKTDARPALLVAVSYEKLPPGLEEVLPKTVESAFAFVQRFPPQGYDNHLFRWSKDRKILDGKSVSLIVTTSRNPSLAPLIQNSGSATMDTFTMSPMDLVHKKIPIIVVLLVDRIFYSANGRERPDGFARLILGLAHEIYGNVQHFLDFDITTAERQTRQSRIAQQTKSYEASIMFLGNLMAHEAFYDLPEKVREDLMALLPLEVDGLRSWRRAVPSAELDPACEAMLKAIAEEKKNPKKH